MFPSDSTVSQVPTVFLCLPHLFSKWLYNYSGPTVFIPFTTRCILNAQFVGPTGSYSVYRRIYFPSSVHGLQAPTVFIRLIAASIFQVVFTVCRFQCFLFCLSPYLFSEWHIVPQLYIHIKQSRVHSRKALYECKASRRLGKQMRCFYRFLSKAHPYSRFIQQPKLRIPSSPY